MYRKLFKNIIVIFALTTVQGLISSCQIPRSKAGLSNIHRPFNTNIPFNQFIKNYPQFPWSSFYRALLSIWPEAMLADAKIELITGGLSSDALFKFSLPLGNFVLRFIGTNRSLAQRKIVIQSFKWASTNDFGPPIILADEQNSLFILSEFIEGRTLTLADTKNPKILREIAHILARVHNTPPPSENYQEFSQFTVGQNWYQSNLIEKNKVIGPSSLREAYNYWLTINDEIKQQHFKKTMLHNDPNLRNILISNNKIVLLDWELAGIEDPRKELAHVCAWFGLDDKSTKEFLLSYYGREPTEQELCILKKLRMMITLEFAWVGLSTLKTPLTQRVWDQYYDSASPKRIEALSIIQMKSKNKPSEKETRTIFLGLIKQFILDVHSNENKCFI